jgi:zinc transport system substrate-binding protein
MKMIVMSVLGRCLPPVAIASALLLLGCGSDLDGPAGGAGSAPRVVAAFYPFVFVAGRVGGGDVVVESLTKPGAEPHDLELTPQQAATVSSADLLVYLRGFQPAVDAAVDQDGPRAALEVGTVDAGTPAAQPRRRHPPNGPAADTPDGDGDPHVWLDPVRLAAVTTRVGEQLAARDPQHADGYRARAATLAGELAALDREYSAGLRVCDRRVIVTSHAAFGHLAARYDLDQVAISGLSPEAEPSPARVAQVQRIVREEGVTTVFFETLVSPKVAETIAAEAGARTAVLDPIEGVAAGSNADYLSLMRANLAALRSALSCR